MFYEGLIQTSGLRIHRPLGHAHPQPAPHSLLDQGLTTLPKCRVLLPRPGEPLAWVSPLEGNLHLGGQGLLMLEDGGGVG